MKRSGDTIDDDTLTIRIPRIPSKIILVGGSSGSGKTTIAGKLCQMVRGATCISMDNFYRSLRDDEDGGSYNWDAVDAIDVDQLVRCITFWRDGLACWVPRHDFAAYKSIPHDKYIISTGIIIIEGIHALSIAKLLPLADIKIFVSCDQDEALARRIMRDTTERGHTLELIISRYFTYVKPAFTNVIAGSRAYADYVIMNNNGTDLDNLLTPLAGVITHHYL